MSDDTSLPGDCEHPGCQAVYPSPKDLSGLPWWCSKHGCQALDGYCYGAKRHKGLHWYLNDQGVVVKAPRADFGSGEDDE